MTAGLGTAITLYCALGTTFWLPEAGTDPDAGSWDQGVLSLDPHA